MPWTAILDVEIAFGMTAARGVGMGEFVDQRDLRPPRDQRVEVHLLECLILVGEPPARQHFEALQQRFGFHPSMGLDHADDDIDAGLLPGVGALQHFVGLADARRGADEDLEPARTAVLAPGRFQEGFRRRTLFRSRRVWTIRQYSPHPAAGLAGLILRPGPMPNSTPIR